MKFLKKFLGLIIALFICCVLFYKFWFLRMPDRKIPNDNTIFVAPANGKIVSVKKWNTKNLIETKGNIGAIQVWTKEVDTAGTIISIQMDPTNVHYQRAPISGKIIAKKYVKGSFNNAVTMSNEYGIRFENEHNEILLESAGGTKYKVIQIAGFLARRIVDYTQPQQPVQQGEVIGLIKLGSQVTVIFPGRVKIEAQTGQTTIDGETILGRE